MTVVSPDARKAGDKHIDELLRSRLRVVGIALSSIVNFVNPEMLVLGGGAGALAMTAVGATASWLKAVFFADNVVLHGFFFFVGKWAFDIVYVSAERRMHGVELATQLLLWSPLSAALTAVAGVILLLMLRPVLEPQAA